MRHWCLVLTVLVGWVNSCFSQESVRKTRVPDVDIYIGLGVSPALMLKENQVFEGDYFTYFDKDTFPEVEWRAFDSTRNLRKDYGSFSLSGTFGVRAWKSLYTGIYYQMINISGYSKPGVTSSLFLKPGSTLFFLIGLQAGYVYRPIKNHPELELVPMFSFGTYYGNEYYGNPGKKWQMNAQIRAQYYLKGRFGLYCAPSYTYWKYKEKGFSESFQRATINRSVFQQLSVDVGVSFRLHLIRSNKL